MAKQSKRGRPPSDNPMSKPISIRLQSRQVETIEDLVERHPIIEDRNTMIRQLIDAGVSDMEHEIKALLKVRGSKP